MSDDLLKNAFDALKDSILKTWGDIPAEITNELAALETLITPVEPPPPPPPAVPPAA